MTTDGQWARTTITVWAASAEPDIHDVGGATLDGQLVAAERWLSEFAEKQEVEPAGDLKVRLLCSWSPADGQHAMTLSPGLIHALAAVKGAYWMDVYPPEPDERA